MRRRLLVSADGLARELSGDRSPVVLDVRWRLGDTNRYDDYLAGHVPTASYVDLERALSDPARGDRRGGRHPLPQPRRFGEEMRAAGVRSDRGVVVYDDSDGTSAARAWWLLLHHGHGDVRVLDGGIAAWRAAGHPLQHGPMNPPPGDWTPQVPGRLPVVDAEGAARLAQEGVLLDARSAERYRGETEPIDPVMGHVPGAVSAPAAGWVDADGRLLPPDVIRDRAAALGVDDGVEVGTYCGSGVTASQTVLALAVAGIDAALYAGSWSDWISDPSRPVATGAGS